MDQNIGRLKRNIKGRDTQILKKSKELKASLENHINDFQIPNKEKKNNSHGINQPFMFYNMPHVYNYRQIVLVTILNFLKRENVYHMSILMMFLGIYCRVKK